MESDKYFRLALLLLKLTCTIAIVVCLTWSTTIWRQEIKSSPEDFQVTFTGTPFRYYHHVCSMPEARSVVVDDVETLSALNLPNGTQFGKNMRTFGRCRAKLTKIQQLASTNNDEVDLALCMCGQQSIYFWLLLMAIGSTLATLVKIVSGLWRTRSVDCSVLAYITSLVWLIFGLLMAVLASTYHLLWFDEIWLPNALYGQSYFRHPVLWSVAVLLIYLQVCLTLAEVCSKKSKNLKSRAKDSSCNRNEEAGRSVALLRSSVIPADRGDENVCNRCLDEVLNELLDEPSASNLHRNVPSKELVTSTWP